MPLLRKLVTLAVTTGIAKKAWDAWRDNKAVASGDRSRTSDKPSAASASWRRERREAERRERG